MEFLVQDYLNGSSSSSSSSSSSDEEDNSRTLESKNVNSTHVHKITTCSSSLLQQQEHYKNTNGNKETANMNILYKVSTDKNTTPTALMTMIRTTKSTTRDQNVKTITIHMQNSDRQSQEITPLLDGLYHIHFVRYSSFACTLEVEQSFSQKQKQIGNWVGHVYLPFPIVSPTQEEEAEIDSSSLYFHCFNLQARKQVEKWALQEIHSFIHQLEHCVHWEDCMVRKINITHDDPQENTRKKKTKNTTCITGSVTIVPHFSISTCDWYTEEVCPWNQAEKDEQDKRLEKEQGEGQVLDIEEEEHDGDIIHRDGNEKEIPGNRIHTKRKRNHTFQKDSLQDSRDQRHGNASSLHMNSNVVPYYDLHISISKPFVLQNYHIQAFVQDLTQSIQLYSQPYIMVSFQKPCTKQYANNSQKDLKMMKSNKTNLHILTNENKTRTFLSLSATPWTHQHVLHFIRNYIDPVLIKYGFDTYRFDDCTTTSMGKIENKNTNSNSTEQTMDHGKAKIHVSIASILGSLPLSFQARIQEDGTWTTDSYCIQEHHHHHQDEEYNNEEDEDQDSTISFMITSICCDIGNNHKFMIPLSPCMK